MKSLLELIFLRSHNAWGSLFASLLLTPLLVFLPATATGLAQSDAGSGPVTEETEQMEGQTGSPSDSANPALLEQLRPVEIRGVELVELEDGLQVVLTADRPELVEVFQFQEGTTLVVDITNATLALDDEGTYRQLNPIPGVASLTLEQRGREIQMTVVSDDETPPVAYLERLSESLQFDLVTAAPGVSDDDIDFGSNNLRIIVTAAPLGYRVQNASTGTRTNTALIDVPQGIQVIPQAVIEDQGTTSLADSLRNVSGANAGRSSTGLQATTPIIRGFESNNVLRNGLRDDTLRIGSGVNNIERIEILKGPASVLFGAGSLSGTINLITEEPLTEPRYEFGTSVGGFGL
ncbi:MAG: TonB-dependent receptor plug domain-containing protein [Cyanobacteria bacterium J06598_3]